MSDKSNPTKKTVYVDVDEEITGIIDKVRSTKESIIALVLPKRATMLQSIVNMKLLKRAADQNDKNVVLITSESTLMALAGAAGLHVAANMQSRPYLPAAPGQPGDLPDSGPIEIEDDEPIDPAATVGSLIDPKQTATEPIEIDNRPKEPAAAAGAAAAKPVKPKKDKNKMIPNFNKFRVLLIAGLAALIFLIGAGYWALSVAPKSTVTLRTESSETPVDARFIANTEADEVDLDSATLPAERREIKKNEIEKVPATGEKDNGTKAAGRLALRNCTDNKVTIPAGTGISSGDLTYITQGNVQLKEGDFNSSSQCKTGGDHTGQVSVIAQNNGDKYNLSPRSYTISGYPGVLAQGEQMSGGTSKITKVVSPSDVEAAKKKISDKQNAAVDEIKSSLKEDGYIGLVDTFSSGTPTYLITPPAGTEANEVAVSGGLTYSMLGIKEDDLKKLVQEQTKDKIDTSKQAILNYGFADATFEIGAKRPTATAVKMKTTLLTGPEINQDDLKKQLAGKKRSEAESLLKGRPGITEARVSFSPFWVTKVPSKEAKVNFNIEQADGKPIAQ